ncbi:MAG TPA: hypothetical protein VKG38_20195, partial [Solirubrobacteraceae bacterium]|nr:hypothetical protein [Solirubrobacteraceae bacterium]
KSGTNGLALQQLAESLGLLAGIRTGTVQIAQAATVPTSPISPLVTRNTILGGILGLLLGLGVAFLLEHFDQRIREPEDLRRIYQLPLLGVVPESSALARFPGRRGRAESHDHGEVAVFGLIRAQLRYCKVDRALRTLLVVSAANGDGKTTIALHLARAAASVGSRVLLLEADLRAPALAEQLVVQPGPGLQDVLTGRESLSSATQTIDLGAAALENSRGQIRPGEAILDVLVAGAGSPPNPGELIESHAMAAVLEQARSTFDLVVIDTPPLAAISDAFPLLRKVDGVIIVGRIGRDRRDAAQRLHDTLKGTDAPLLGVIANGVKAGGGSHRYSSRMGMRRKRNIQVWRPNEGKTLHEHVGLNRPLAPVAASDPQSAAGMQLGSKRRSVAPPEGEYSPPAHESAAGRDG